MPSEKFKKYLAIMIRNSVKITLVLLFICHTTTCFAEYNPVQNIEQGEDRKMMKMAKNTKLSSDERAISSQPRMYTSGGHLFFETASSYNISFKTNDKGSINFDGTDLKPLMAQVEKNRQDILDIKNSGGGTVPPDLQNQVDTNKQNIQQLQTQANDHNSRLDDLESQYTTLQATVTSIQNDLNKDECSGSPCRNGGTCTDLYKSFLCTCPAQYEGPTCELDHNECLDFDKTGAGCQNGGTCVNLDGGFQCNCPPSYYGPLCASVYDDCTDGNDKCVHGLCVNSPRDDPNVPKYSCICDNGWTSVSDTDPTCTKDVDECLNTPCSANPLVQCYNTQGSFTCGDCPSGYQGNGYYCADIDECATNNGGCNMSPLVQCINIPGSSYCGPCPAGYTGDGVVCTPQDPCTSNNGGCHPIASCSYNPAAGAVACTCPPGYVGTGIGPYGCSLSDNNCTDTCVNGQCIMSNGQLTCMCDPGWMGDNCDYNINECGSNPCQHGGKCNDGINGYTCTCNSGYSGTNCELQQSACGGDYEASSGSFLYPATNGQTYPSESDCTWTVKVPLGKAASVTFPKFDLEQSTDCKNDFLQINDGPRLDSPVIGKYCGSSTPGGGDAILSTGNELLFWFSSNDANSGQGFQVVWTSQDPVCGGDITGVEYGTISSPGYPGNYPNNRDCYWTISVVPGNVIQLLLGTIDLETSSDCSKDYLEIRDGILSTDPVLATYCTSISAAPLLTTSSGARLYLHTNEANTGTGFFIQWSILPTVCGGYISDDDGIIISPNYPNVYDDDQQCVWQIHVGDYGKISITFTDLDIPGDENCANDYIEVRDGPREFSPLAARYCGTTIPPMYTSSGQDLYLKFKSDQYATGKGFRLLYTVACGGTYTFESGTLVSPYYPSMYPNDKECEYTIRQPPGYLITLTIEDIDIENDPTCASDYLEIHDGSIEESPLLGKICGNVPAPPMMSTQNYMFIHFKSNSQNNGRGFRASFTSANTGCGGVYTDAVGSLKSPGHPSSYPHGVNCTYYIWVDPSLIISLQFLSFSLQDSEDGDCNDYVEVFDGPDTDSPSLGRFCGSTVPPTLVSKSFEMTLLFTTDNNTDSQGFAAAYTTQNASTACGGYISDQEGYISSPNYPDNYPAMRTCVWTITMPSSMQIQVDFADFAFEAGNAEGTCSFDYLEIRNGGYEDSPLIGEYCGNNNPGTFISHSNQLYVKMVTDQYTEARGFLMNYNAGVTGCGGTLTSADGGFQSPNYPFPYPHAAECTWLIQVSQGSTVRLLFSNFDIETHGFCEFDYVEAYDGPSAGYPSLGRVCGTRIPEPYESSDNSLFVRFRSDGNTAGSGFLAQYHTICERTITSRVSGVIESLDFPDNYPPNRDCTWTIQGSYGNPLNATFKTFAVETCDNCNCDYVEIIDGDDSDSTSLGKYCGSQLPPIIRTSGSSLQVVFHSDPYQQAPGFQLAWAVDGCGNTFTDPSGEFSSPNYPNNYDDNKECIWQIITDPGTNIQLTIDVFDVEHHSDCQYDTLEVYNGLYVDEDYRIAQLCNSNSPPHLPMKVSSTSSFMTVRFITDELVNGKGFHASYEQKTGGCGGLLTSQSGTIRSPNFPNTYPANTDCEWLIDVGKGTTVTLAFKTFDIEEEPNCEFDYVVAYDGNSTTGTQLMKACGKTLPPTIQSYDNMMLVQFHSDPFTAHSGFEANFYSSGCGGRLTASITMNEDIMSIDYPNNYPANQNCTWTISAPQANGHITLKFTHLDLYTNISDNSPCGTYDYILLLDGTSVSSPEFARYCGSTIPAPITSFSNAFTIVFVSQSPEQRGGFRFLYSASTSGCGGDLTSQSGYFNSPNFPEEYPVDTDCVWTIRSSPGNRVQLSFLFFDMEDHDSCNFDYVEIKEGSADGQTIARVCGSKIPANVSSIVGHILYVKFHSDVGTVGRGFQAYYQHLYGGTTIGEFSGEIASPMYPSTYPDLIDAYYYVYAPTGRLIYFEFTLLDLQGLTDEGCPYDYVIIYDGDSESSPALAAGCGTGYLPQGTTSQPAMMVWFHSDLGISGRGFYISWSAVDGGGIGPNPTNVPTIEPGVCGSNHMVAPLAPIPLYSPGWPDKYPNNQDCRWLIEAASGYRVEFTVLSMDIEGAGIACVDSLTIYDGPDITSREIVTYCGKSAPPTPLYSTQEFMLVRFKSDSTLPYRGFTAQYQQGCGGTITSNQGIITSPNYPGNYPVDTDCVWVISATLGYTISLDFNSQYEIINSDSDQCGEDNGDYLQLLNGKFDDSPPLPGVDGDGRYCGTSPPTGLKTSSYYLYVKFRSDSQSTGNGFSLTFTAAGTGCGGNLQLTDELNAGTFSSPNYPSAYPHGADCIWIISAPAGEAIQLDFTAFSVEGDSSCRYDYVAVVDGQTSNDPILGIYCGSSQPPTTKSTGNTMLVRFRTDETTAAGGFQATYKIAACGGLLTGTSGFIQSPNYPDNYPNSVSCDWEVRGPAYHFLAFRFTYFNLFGSDTCESGKGDFIEFRLSNATAPPFATVCGSTNPGQIDTDDNIAHIHFESDSSDTSGGFRMEFKASEDLCGGELTGPTGLLTTPNYPNEYDHARVCTWYITVASDRRVTLEFIDFDVEDPHEDFGCVFDYVQINNGILPNSPRLATLCGADLPGKYSSTGNTMKVIFKTDGSVSNGGFAATYSSDDPRVCGGVLNDFSGGLFTTPNYPDNYGYNQECLWTITAPVQTNVTTVIMFRDFSLEHHIECNYDKVIFKAGTGYDGYLYQTLCGDTKPEDFALALPDSFIQFISDYSVNDKGFQASYQFKPCGGLVTGTTSGVIASPNFPAPYNSNDFCLWTIAVPAGQHIKLQWTNFHVESHSLCGYDYVKVFNGPTPSSPLVGTYCNDNEPGNFTAGSNTVTILFRSDYSEQMDGWRVKWSADTSGCGNVIIHKHYGVITSPNYPNEYPGNSDCTWTILPDPAYHVDITFEDDFQIEQQSECAYDYVAIFDGPSESSSKMNQFCGYYGTESAPGDDTVVESSEAALTMRFRSDFSRGGKGFKAYYEAHCGLTLKRESGTFQSPNYPSPYNNNEQCFYLITYPDEDKFIKLTFTRFVLESGTDTACIYDYVKVYAGTTTDDRLLGSFCGNFIPTNSLSSQGSMLVVFATDSVTVDYGFQADYEGANCGGFLTDTTGSINAFTHSNIHNNGNCTWQIQVADNKVVELEFTSFDVEAHISCSYDYVNVYNGLTTFSPLIGTYCGNFVPKYLISSTNEMTIEFITDAGTTENGFTSIYRQMAGPLEGCGGLLTDQTGSFSSLDLDGDGNYDANLNCLWVIQGTENQIITISFTKFDLENGTTNGCIYDRVEIHDGQTELDPIAVSACGIIIPAPFTSSTNFLSVRFIADPYVQYTGFDARYTMQEKTCGGNYKATSDFQEISYPPASMPSMVQNANCRWTIDAGTDITMYIMVTFTQVDIQSPSNTGTNCNSAYVEVRDYPPGDLVQSFKYCSNGHNPSDFHSLGQMVQLNLKTDADTTGQGFKVQYRGTNCSRDLTQPYGQIFSPGWPTLYPHDTICITTITVPEDNQIQMFFNEFELEYHVNCSFDYLEIRDGLTEDSPLLQRLCGTSLPNPIFPTSNSLFMKLSSDPFVHEKGFDITYTSTPNACGGIITGDHGTITSLDFPQAYSPNTTCEFSIRAPSGRPVTIHMTYMDVYYECGSNGCYCADDVIWIYGGPDRNSPLIAGYCGYGRVSDLQSPVNSAFVRFVVSDFEEGTRSNTGFRIEFES